MNKQKRIQILKRLRDNNPKPETEVNFSSPFELLVAVTLSAQATDVSVNKATDKLFPVANTAQAIYDLGVDGKRFRGAYLGTLYVKDGIVKATPTGVEVDSASAVVVSLYETAGAITSIEYQINASDNSILCEIITVPNGLI